MLVLLIIDTVVLVLLGGLVAGLLRSYTDILRTLDALRREVLSSGAAASSASGVPAPKRSATERDDVPEGSEPLAGSPADKRGSGPAAAGGSSDPVQVSIRRGSR